MATYLKVEDRPSSFEDVLDEELVDVRENPDSPLAHPMLDACGVYFSLAEAFGRPTIYRILVKMSKDLSAEEAQRQLVQRFTKIVPAKSPSRAKVDRMASKWPELSSMLHFLRELDEEHHVWAQARKEILSYIDSFFDMSVYEDAEGYYDYHINKRPSALEGAAQ
jgi:hypothetical protein